MADPEFLWPPDVPFDTFPEDPSDIYYYTVDGYDLSESAYQLYPTLTRAGTATRLYTRGGGQSLAFGMNGVTYSFDTDTYAYGNATISPYEHYSYYATYGTLMAGAVYAFPDASGDTVHTFGPASDGIYPDPGGYLTFALSVQGSVLSTRYLPGASYGLVHTEPQRMVRGSSNTIFVFFTKSVEYGGSTYDTLYYIPFNVATSTYGTPVSVFGAQTGAPTTLITTTDAGEGYFYIWYYDGQYVKALSADCTGANPTFSVPISVYDVSSRLATRKECNAPRYIQGSVYRYAVVYFRNAFFVLRYTVGTRNSPTVLTTLADNDYHIPSLHSYTSYAVFITFEPVTERLVGVVASMLSWSVDYSTYRKQRITCDIDDAYDLLGETSLATNGPRLFDSGEIVMPEWVDSTRLKADMACFSAIEGQPEAGVIFNVNDENTNTYFHTVLRFWSSPGIIEIGCEGRGGYGAIAAAEVNSLGVEGPGQSTGIFRTETKESAGNTYSWDLYLEVLAGVDGTSSYSRGSIATDGDTSVVFINIEGPGDYSQGSIAAVANDVLESELEQRYLSISTQYAVDLLALINQERASVGVAPLKLYGADGLYPGKRDIANLHSVNMAWRRIFAHNDDGLPEGQETTVIRGDLMPALQIAENLYMQSLGHIATDTWTGVPPPEDAYTWWYNSPEHYANMVYDWGDLEDQAYLLLGVAAGLGADDLPDPLPEYLLAYFTLNIVTLDAAMYESHLDQTWTNEGALIAGLEQRWTNEAYIPIKNAIEFKYGIPVAQTLSLPYHSQVGLAFEFSYGSRVELAFELPYRATFPVDGVAAEFKYGLYNTVRVGTATEITYGMNMAATLYLPYDSQAPVSTFQSLPYGLLDTAAVSTSLSLPYAFPVAANLSMPYSGRSLATNVVELTYSLVDTLPVGAACEFVYAGIVAQAVELQYSGQVEVARSVEFKYALVDTLPVGSSVELSYGLTVATILVLPYSGNIEAATALALPYSLYDTETVYAHAEMRYGLPVVAYATLAYGSQEYASATLELAYSLRDTETVVQHVSLPYWMPVSASLALPYSGRSFAANVVELTYSLVETLPVGAACEFVYAGIVAQSIELRYSGQVEATKSIEFKYALVDTLFAGSSVELSYGLKVAASLALPYSGNVEANTVLTLPYNLYDTETVYAHAEMGYGLPIVAYATLLYGSQEYAFTALELAYSLRDTETVVQHVSLPYLMLVSASLSLPYSGREQVSNAIGFNYSLIDTLTVTGHVEIEYGFPVATVIGIPYAGRAAVNTTSEFKYALLDTEAVSAHVELPYLMPVAQAWSLPYDARVAVDGYEAFSYALIDTVFVGAGTEMPYGMTVAAYVEAPYVLRSLCASYVAMPYSNRVDLTQHLEAPYSLRPLTAVGSSVTLYYDLADDLSEVVTNSAVYLHHGSFVTRLRDVVIDSSELDVGYRLSCVIEDPEVYFALKERDDVLVDFAGEIYYFTLTSKEVSRESPTSIGMKVYGTNTTDMLQKPYQGDISYSQTEAATSRELVEFLYDGTLVYDILDWAIPANRLDASATSLLSILTTIAEAVGAVVDATPEGHLWIHYPRPYKTNQLLTYAPDTVLTDRDDTLSAYTVAMERDGANKFRIREGDMSYSDSLYWELDEKLSTATTSVGTVSAYLSPYRSSAELRHVGGATWVTPLEEKVHDHTEYVEFTSGAASTIYPIHNVVSLEWVTPELSDVSYQIGYRDLTASLDVEQGYGYVKIKYTTKCLQMRAGGLPGEMVDGLLPVSAYAYFVLEDI